MSITKQISKSILALLECKKKRSYKASKLKRRVWTEVEQLGECGFDECFDKAMHRLIHKGLVTQEGDRVILVSQEHVDIVASDCSFDKEELSQQRKRVRTDPETADAGKTSPSEVLSADQQVACDAVPEECEAPSHPSSISRGGNNTILLFYAYCDPQMSRAQQDNAIAKCYGKLSELGMTGRLRVGREGFNCTLTGPSDNVRRFTAFLREFDPKTFGETDFKYVDNQPDSQLLKGLKVWPVTEIVTYGFNPADAPLDMRGTHLKPHEFHEALANPNSVVIDVRNFNESLIGRFNPPLPPGVDDIAEKVLDPCMRRSTEFPDWIKANRHKLEGKQVLMYCTAGVRCERASAFMRNQGIENVFQLEGGIHRYLDAYPKDGGYWIGKNYVFDKRFAHGAEKCDVVSTCVHCDSPWDRYNAQKKCIKCGMEVLLCKDCQRIKPAVPKTALFCPLCKPRKQRKLSVDSNSEKTP